MSQSLGHAMNREGRERVGRVIPRGVGFLRRREQRLGAVEFSQQTVDVALLDHGLPGASKSATCAIGCSSGCPSSSCTSSRISKIEIAGSTRIKSSTQNRNHPIVPMYVAQSQNVG